jgi:hypothetical protein
MFQFQHFSLLTSQWHVVGRTKSDDVMLHLGSDNWVCCWAGPMAKIPNHRRRSSFESCTGFPPADGVST